MSLSLIKDQLALLTLQISQRKQSIEKSELQNSDMLVMLSIYDQLIIDLASEYKILEQHILNIDKSLKIYSDIAKSQGTILKLISIESDYRKNLALSSWQTIVKFANELLK